MNKLMKEKKSPKKIFRTLIIVILLMISPLLLNFGLDICVYYGHQNFYNKTHEEYIKIAEEYVEEKYGDHYKVIDSYGVYGGWAIIGEGFQGIEFVFADTNGIESNFTILVGSGDHTDIVQEDTYSNMNSIE